MKRCTSQGLTAVLLALSIAAGTSSCGSGTSSVGTVPTSSPGTSATLTAKVYDIGPNANVVGITIGSDGNIWFSECPDNDGFGAIARLTTSAQITIFPLPDGANACPAWLTLAKDGAVWFTEQPLHGAVQEQLGRITATGSITEFALPAGDGAPFGIAVGGDGNIWYDTTTPNGASTSVIVRAFVPFTDTFDGSVSLAPLVMLSARTNTLRVNPTDGALIVASGGNVLRVETGPSPRTSLPFGIPSGTLCAATAPGKDGNLYLQCNAQRLAAASQATYHTVFLSEPVSIALSSGLTPVSLVGPMGYGSDRNLYLAGVLGTSPTVFAMSTTGVIEAFYVDPNVNDRPVDVVRGADGAMWFTVSNAARGTVVRVAPYQAVTYER